MKENAPSPQLHDDFKGSFKNLVQDLRRQKATHTRLRVERGIREYFNQEGFLEVRTPLLVASPGMEPHIRPMAVDTWSKTDSLFKPSFLPTSPEFAMKKLLSGGLEKIFQICPAFRDEPVSTTHFPEFTLLEWYRAGGSVDSIRSDTENLIESLAIDFFGEAVIPYQGVEIDVSTPWDTLKINDLFKSMVGIDLEKVSTVERLSVEVDRLGLSALGSEDPQDWDDLYFKIWLNCIEPKLPKNRPVFVTHYPASQAALAKLVPDPITGTLWADRFELYVGGLELANAFNELTNPDEQKERFEKDMKLRTRLYQERILPSPVDQEFISALRQGLPSSAGIALGVDRLIMLFADETDISFTFWLPPYWHPNRSV